VHKIVCQIVKGGAFGVAEQAGAERLQGDEDSWSKNDVRLFRVGRGKCRAAETDGWTKTDPGLSYNGHRKITNCDNTYELFCSRH